VMYLIEMTGLQTWLTCRHFYTDTCCPAQNNVLLNPWLPIVLHAWQRSTQQQAMCPKCSFHNSAIRQPDGVPLVKAAHSKLSQRTP
jgi:hypothetical protein